MPQGKRPQSIKLRKVPRKVDYGFDCGRAHLIDRGMHLGMRNMIWPKVGDSRIGRYIDGEDEVEGTFR